MRLESNDDFERMAGMFRSEPDPWLRKMLAIRLLDYPHADVAPDDFWASIQKAIQCRVT